MSETINKIKILYVITKSNWGGAQKYVYDLATHLPPEKFEITVVLGGDGLLFDKLSHLGINTIKIPLLRRDINFFKEIASLFSLYKIFLKEKPDIIHLNSSKIGGLGAVTGKITGLVSRHPSKIIFTAHGWAFNEDRAYIARVIIYFLQWISVLFCDSVIVVSHAVQNQGMYFPFAKHKLVLIQNAIQPPQFLEPKEARLTLANIANIDKTTIKEEEFPWIGTVAELTKNKGLIYLIDAYAILQKNKKDFKAFILGDGEDQENLESRILNLGLENSVFLLGFVEDASRYLKAFDVFVLPSLTEASPYVLREVGWASLPVVATKVGGIPEVVENDKNGYLVPSKNPEALAEAIKKLVGSQELRNKMGKKNYDLISQKFSFEKMLNETVLQYKKPPR